MATHELKTDPGAFDAVVRGDKTVELRENDRSFGLGDFLLLRKTVATGKAMSEGASLIYTGEVALVQVTHIVTGYGMKDGYCAMSINGVIPNT